ncbi:cyclic peptide export ABC transporter [Oceaniglobus roseus]|uniref:cyclic peptide export ABC transporter n=1 Tax=Oceaniglobus roseus TaxID=1737570 RepID=UPI000C7F23EE|nr:cyclic peptide export ABC transporter [Kandeliimicrobium roseum]
MIALIRHLFRAEPRRALWAILLGVGSGASAAAMAIVVSRALQTDDRTIWMAVLFFAATVGHAALRVMSGTQLIRLTQSIALALRIRLGHRVLATPQHRLRAIGRQPLLTIQTRDVDAFSGSVQLIPLIIGNLLMMLGCFAYMAIENWRICAAVLACLVIGAAAFRLAERGPLIRLAQLRADIDTLYIHQRAVIEGAKELQLNQQRGKAFVDRVLGPAAGAVAREYVAATSAYIWVTNIGNSLFYLVIGVVLFGLSGVSSTDLLPVVLLILYLVKPVSEVLIALPPLRQAGVALDRIEQLGADLADVADAAPARPLDPQRIALEGVTHSYTSEAEDGEFTLGPLDLTVSRGEILFLVGGNGSGKTTLAMLLCGLFTPDRGRITADRLSISPETLGAYRGAFSAVFSDFHLFEHLPGSDDPAMEEHARDLIRRFRMDHKVSVAEGRLSTTDLSSGQRKRLALVAAYLEDRPFYLFDEWAADQDPAFKDVFYRTLLPDLKARGKGVIVITHDDAYFDTADRVVKLAEGRVLGEAA